MMAGCCYRFHPMTPQKTLTWLLMTTPLLIMLAASHAILVSGQCQEDQQSLLLQLKQGLSFSQTLSVKLVRWRSSIDCCKWPGITCNVEGLGRVIGLNLSNDFITTAGGGGLHNSSPLFRLQHLQFLDLSLNNFNTNVPTAIANLTSLRHLNLSCAGFFGQIPAADISQMRSLVTLDISWRYFWDNPFSLKLENPNLAVLVQNLTGLSDLRLDGVNLSSTQGWCKTLASSLPNLKVLSMSNCLLSGPIDFSLSNLHSLSVLRLDSNNFSSPVPDFFAALTNLTVLSLRSCELSGTFPTKILQMSSLELLDLSYNYLLQGHVPDFPGNDHHYSMQTLMLSYTNFSGVLPPSIGNLVKLSRMELVGCNFTGILPRRSLENLSELAYLDLSFNNFTGTIPSLGSSKNLVRLDLSHNQLAGDLHAHNNWASFQKLEHVDLSYNSFNGSIPKSLFDIPSISWIDLSFNQLASQVPEFSHAAAATSSVVEFLDLSSNNLEGPIPGSIFELRKLNALSLSSNRLSGIVHLSWFQTLQNLTTLELSYNNLTVDVVSGSNNNSIRFSALGLAACNLSKFPELGNYQSDLSYLDLSGYDINGVVPQWILESPALFHLNLSHNNLVGLQVPLSLPLLDVLDMHDNQLQGNIPIIPSTSTISYVDYSHNLFNVSVPAEISNYLSFAHFFSLSNNQLTGPIPASICNGSRPQVLDLSDNNLNGPIPSCLVENIKTLDVLNLRGHKLSGNIPDIFQPSCSLKTLDLSSNQLQGRIPKSLQNCMTLQVLNLANNKISDVFPCMLGNLPDLRVLVLRNNFFKGSIGCPHVPGTWQKLHIVDLAFNKFSGPINDNYLATWVAMMGDGEAGRHDHLKVELVYPRLYYQDSITLTSKGLSLELVKILTVYTSLDFSSNNLDGPIPETVGKFGGIYFLNFSHNAFTGKIPSVFGNLSQLESLDLSDNKLNGEIPQQLSGLTFLSVLNLSNNDLVGSIPTGRQLQTFENTSYEGNPGLCGSPLTKSCSEKKPPGVSVNHGESGKGINWTPLSIEFGFTFGLGVVILPAAFWPRFRIWFWPQIDSLILGMFPRLYDKDHKNCLRRRRRRRGRIQ